MSKKNEPFAVALPKVSTMGKGEIKFEKTKSQYRGRKATYSLSLWFNGELAVRLNMPSDYPDPDRWFEDAMYNGMNQIRDSLRKF